MLDGMLYGLLYGLIALPFVALIPAIIAAGKGRNFFLWYFYGLLFFIIALIHALLIKPDQRRLDAKAIKSGQGKRCPSCAEIIKADAKVCRYCGRDTIVAQWAT